MTTKQDESTEPEVQETAATAAGPAKRSTTRKQSGAKSAKGAASKAGAKAAKGKAATGKAAPGKAATGKAKSTGKGTATKGKAAASKADDGAGKGRATAEKASERPARPAPRALPRLHGRFREEIAPQLLKEFAYTSPMAVPRLSKIVLNIGLGEALENGKAIENAMNDLSLITGQHPITTRARKSIANFKVREGMALGLAVSLRGRRMYEFFDRLISSALPRIRDFRGISRESFDGRGNYTLGIREQVIFPEIDYNSIDRIRGLQVVVVTTARTDQEGLRLLELFGVPFTRTEADATAA